MGESDGGEESTRSAPRRKRKRVRKKKTARSTTPQVGEGASSTEQPGGERGESSRRGSGGRSSRPARSKASPETESDHAAGSESGSASESSEEKKGRRRRGTRGGRRRRRGGTRTAAVVDAIPGEDDLPELPELPDDAEQIGRGTTKKRKRSRSRGRKTASRSDEPGEESSAPARAGGATAKKAAKKTARKTTKKTAKKAAKKTSKKTRGEGEEPQTQTEVLRTDDILVNATEKEEKRVAVVRGGQMIEFLMTSDSQKSLVNDIYRGRVVNLEPAIGAAFIDFGQGRNGFLHTSDVLAAYGEKGFDLTALLSSKVDPEEWDEASSQPSIGTEVDSGATDADDNEAPETERSKSEASGKARARKPRKPRRRGHERRPISDLLKVGDQVVVQVTKDAIGDKGPTLTTYLSIPGRYLVLMPSMAHTGVSRKVPDDKERRRLKRVLTSLKQPTDMGVIVRTAGVGKTKVDLQRDLDYLLGVWDTIGRRLKSGRGPLPLYQESDLAIRTLRDLFSSTTNRVVVDDPMVHDQVLSFAKKLMPDQVDRITLHDGLRPVFHHFGVEQDFEKIFARRVELPSGGSIVFDQAEALVAIDVNSGRTRTESFDFEEIALKTNLEAVPEIARQMRLRDLGGILVLDFIDMMKGSSKSQVERALRAQLAEDRARSKIGRISQFGLLEMTRQRLGPGVYKKVFQICTRCRGTGHIRSVESRAQAILRRLGSALTQKGFSRVELRAHPEVIEHLKEELWDYVRALEHRSEKELQLTAVPDQAEDSVLRYLRADGREVRPGGRRKR